MISSQEIFYRDVHFVDLKKDLRYLSYVEVEDTSTSEQSKVAVKREIYTISKSLTVIASDNNSNSQRLYLLTSEGLVVLQQVSRQYCMQSCF